MAATGQDLMAADIPSLPELSFLIIARSNLDSFALPVDCKPRSKRRSRQYVRRAPASS